MDPLSEPRSARSKRLLERLSHHLTFSQKLGISFDACCSDGGTVEISALQDSKILASAGCGSPLVLDEQAGDGRIGRRGFAGALASHAIARIRSDEAMSELKAAFHEVLALRGHQLSITAAERELAAAADQSGLCEVSVVSILEATHDEQSVLSRKFGAFLAEIDKAWTRRLNVDGGTPVWNVGEDEFIRITRSAIHKAARDVFDAIDTPEKIDGDDDDAGTDRDSYTEAEAAVGSDRERAVAFDGSAGSRRARRWTTHVQQMRSSSLKRRASSSPTAGNDASPQEDDDAAEHAIVWAHETVIDDAAVPASAIGTRGVAAPATPTPTISVDTPPAVSDIALLTTMLVEGAGAGHGHLAHAQLEQARFGGSPPPRSFPESGRLPYTRCLLITRSWSDSTTT